MNPAKLEMNPFPANGAEYGELADGWYLGCTTSNEYVAFYVNNDDGCVGMTDHMNNGVGIGYIVEYALIKED